MNRSAGALLLILLVQCVLVATVYWPQAGPQPKSAGESLAPFNLDLVDEIHVGDEYDNETVLQRIGQRWLLPELERLPADTAMVDQLLAALDSAAGIWPVASSVAARQRFQVASYYYQRRIRLFAEDRLMGTILLGTSPGFRKVYARNEGQDAIYGIAFNTFDAPGSSGAWLERKLLQIRTPVAIIADSYSLRREGGAWRSGIGLVPDERELQALLSALRSLQVSGVAGEDSQRDLADTEADLVLAVQGLAGDVTLELFQLAGQHYVHSSEYPLFFRLGAYDYDRLMSIDIPLISGEREGGANRVDAPPRPTRRTLTTGQ